MRDRILILAFFLSSIYGSAQNKVPAPAASAAATETATDAATRATTPDDSYIIGSSDVLKVTVWKDTTLSGDLLVRPDGKISMPLLGDIPAAGQKPMQLATQITDQLKKFMKDPEVSVVVSKIHDNFVYLLGEVGKKGPVVMTPDMTLLEAISSGGGVTDYANKKKIYILRDVDGKQQRLPVNYKKALSGDAASNLALVPGDTIVVP